ncbi:MAG: FHA domain-containing protein [Xanthomonadales bacterium]
MNAVRQSGGCGLRRVLLPLLLLFAATCAAQSIDPRSGRYALNEDGSMPPWVVPVLRLVSSTHVEPTTGLVLSDSGLVLVPMGFAAEGDEVIVLDGGTDIVRNGRPAHLKDYFPAEGLQILSVPGLRRQPAPFATEALIDGTRVELTAFPPAERIAEGDPPLHTAATVVVFGTNGAPAVSGETPLPNVTGPLLDECGNVAAYSLAHDLQTMASHPGTRYKWRETLLAVLTRLGVTPAPSACRAAASEPAEEATTEEAEPEAAEETLAIDRLPPIETDRPPPAPDAPPAWPWLLLGLALIAAGAWVHWRRRRAADATPQPPGADAVEKPDPDAVDDLPAHTPQLDRRLALRGVLADGTPVDIGCAVSSRAINVVIGRGATADLVLASAAVSRQHARLNGTADALTVADLGSSNGTSVNGVPCLEGEILYLERGDVLVLGDAQLSVEFEPLEVAEP